MNEMTYKQFLEFLAQAYDGYASSKQRDIAFMCLVAGECTSQSEGVVRDSFLRKSGLFIYDPSLSHYRQMLLNTIDVNKMNCCAFYEDLGRYGNAYSVERMRRFLKTRVQNPNKLRAMLLRKWSEESVLE